MTGSNLPSKNNDSHEINIHSAIAGASNSLIVKYQQIQEKYNFPAIKNISQAINCGNYLPKVFDEKKVIEKSRLKLKTGIEVSVIDIYQAGKRDSFDCRDIDYDKGECVTIGKKKLLKGETYYLVKMDNGKSGYTLPEKVESSLEFLPCPTILESRRKDKAFCDNLIMFMIGKTARSFNIKNNMDEGQIKESLQTIIDEYGFLKLSDLYLILKIGKLGRFGKIYDRFDENVLMEWFDYYVKDRMEVSEEVSLVEHSKHTANEKSRSYDGFLQKMYNQSVEGKNEERIKIQKEINEKAYTMVGKIMSTKKKEENVSNNKDKKGKK